MTVAERTEFTDAALTPKVVLVAPAKMVTEPGNSKFVPDNVTDAPPVGAAALKFAVQFVLPGVAIMTGLQVKETRVAVVPIPEPVIVPPIPEMVRAPPLGSEAEVPVTLMGVLLTPELIVTFTAATTPLAMIFAFMPVARHV